MHMVGARAFNFGVEPLAGQRSLWLEQALDRNPTGAPCVLRRNIRCDICIVGAGFTGLWTTLRLQELDPSLSIAVIDADLCGSGASGRNTGQALSWWSKSETLVHRFGRSEALRLARLSRDAIDEIGAFCRANAVDAEFAQTGWIWAATSPSQLGAWQTAIDSCAELGEHPFRELTPEEIQQRIGSEVFLGGIVDESAAVVHPGLLSRGLMTVAIARGASVYEMTPAMSIDRDTGTVHVPFGSVQASCVVLTLGAWASGLRSFRRDIVPVTSDIVATEPIREQLDASGWTGGEAITNSRLTLRYARRTLDDRLIFGRSGRTIAFHGHITPSFLGDYLGNPRASREFERFVPAARGARITHAWGGPVDRTVDGLPQFGVMTRGRSRVVYGHGFSGNGVAPSLVGARILAALVLERDDEWGTSVLIRSAGSRFPPEPMRYVGGLLVIKAVNRMENRLEEEKRVDLISRGLARLAPKGLINLSQTRPRRARVLRGSAPVNSR